MYKIVEMHFMYAVGGYRVFLFFYACRWRLLCFAFALCVMCTLGCAFASYIFTGLVIHTAFGKKDL